MNAKQAYKLAYMWHRFFQSHATFNMVRETRAGVRVCATDPCDYCFMEGLFIKNGFGRQWYAAALSLTTRYTLL